VGYGDRQIEAGGVTPAGVAMPVRVGINGFGRMGRLALRVASDNPQIKIVHINELKGGPQTAAHLLEFDSVHGRWRVPIVGDARGLKINGERISYSNFDAPGEVPWDQARVEIVLECSGKFLTPDLLAPYFNRGICKVVVAAPVKQGALKIVMGVNDQLYDPELHHIVTAASCTTNCLAPE
jgi:glyceraldehyde 3-phosphate dehydrogenase